MLLVIIIGTRSECLKVVDQARTKDIINLNHVVFDGGSIVPDEVYANFVAMIVFSVRGTVTRLMSSEYGRVVRHDAPMLIITMQDQPRI